MSKMRLDMQISRNLDENANCLVEVKHKVESEANSWIIEDLKKYESAYAKLLICFHILIVTKLDQVYWCNKIGCNKIFF